MSKTQILAMLGLACALAQQAASAQMPTYQYQDLGQGAAAYAINNAGLVVGERYNAQNTLQAVVWDRQGSPSFLPDLWGSSSAAFAINQQGQIAGQAWSLGTIPQAVAWSGGAITTLATQPHQPFGAAVGINSKGEVVGNTSTSYGGDSQPVVWRGLDVTPLDKAAGTSSIATGINDAGLVTGYTLGIPGTFNPQAVVWRDGIATPLPNLTSNYAYSIAHAVNRDGVVVGDASTGSNGDIRAVVWRNDEVSALSALSDSDRAFGINDLGVVVGALKASGGFQRAALWDTNTNTNGDLNALVGEGVLPADITLIDAYAINNLGDIVGRAFNKATGNYSAYALRAVPETSTLLMWGMGMTGLILVRRRRTALS